MSHFLERLAASVAGSPAGPRLRPLSGSIYRPAQPTALPNASWEQVAESPADAFGDEAPQSKPISRAAQSKPGTRSDAFDESRAGALPRMTSSPQIDSAPQPDGSASRERTIDRTNTAVRNGAAPRTLEQSDSEERRGRLSRSQEPPEHLLPLRAEETLVRPEMVVPRPASGERGRLKQEPAREPDAITIHIGRIEVAAVTQPVLRPAPAKAARKAMSLDEYLRRGNGRAR